MNVADLLDSAIRSNLRIATAESCTGGLIAAALTDVAGSSRVFDRGFVTYSNAAKQELLGVHRETLERYGAVSEQVAKEMAEGALSRADADLAVAVTGIAGPGGSEFKPEGLVCFAIASKERTTVTDMVEFGALGRLQVRIAARDHALVLIGLALTAPPPSTPRARTDDQP